MEKLKSKESVGRIAISSVLAEKTTGFPAEISFAQCALESGWLSHCPGNNCFGIKFSAKRHSAKQLLKTKEFLRPAAVDLWVHSVPGRAIVREVKEKSNRDFRCYEVMDWFAKYKTLEDCFDDHAKIITTGGIYSSIWNRYLETKNLENLIRGLDGKYATSPDYSKSIFMIIGQEDVKEAIKEARENV